MVKQSLIIEKGIIEFENYFKHIKFMLILVVLFTKLFVLKIGLISQLLFMEVKMQLMNLLKQFLKSIDIAKK